MRAMWFSAEAQGHAHSAAAKVPALWGWPEGRVATMMRKPPPKRSRIQTLQDQIDALEEVVDLHRRTLEIQFQRIAQIQADLDAIRSAWMQAKPKG